MVLDALYHVAYDDLRFYQVIVGAQFFGGFFIFGLAKGREHDYADITGLGSVTQDIQHIKARYLRHHGVEHNKVGFVFERGRKRLFAIDHMADVETL